MKSSHWIKGAFAILLALGFFLSVHQPAAAAGSGACAAYTPSEKGAPSGFGSTLDTPTIQGLVIAVCSNERNGYDSQSWNGYGDPFQRVELTNRYAAQIFGSPVTDWGGDAKYH